MKRVVLSSCVAALVLAPVITLAQSRTPPAGATTVGSAGDRGSSSAPAGGSSGSSSGGGSSASGAGGYSGGGGSSVGTGAGGYNAPSSISRGSSGRAAPRSGEAPSAYSRGEARGSAGIGQAVPAGVRPRGDGPVYGYAAPRGSVQPKNPGTGPNSGPYGGYDYWPPVPWGMYYGYGAWYGWNNYFDWSPYFGAYGGPAWSQYSMWPQNYMMYAPYAWFTPWSVFDDLGPAGYGYAGGAYRNTYDLGTVRFKVKPKDAEVWVDGYLEGRADSKVQLKAGNHKVEIKAKGYETLVVEMRVMPGRTVSYTGELKPAAK